MSLLSGRSKVIVERDYTEQLIFSNKVPMSVKNRICFAIIGLLFSLFTINVVQAMANNPILERLF